MMDLLWWMTLGTGFFAGVFSGIAIVKWEIL